MTPDDLAGLIGATLEGWEIDSGDIEGVGISVAALVDDTGRILRAENLGWSDVPLAAIVAGAVGRPARVDSDVFCGALYEMRVGHARAASSALYIAVGTGVGHAFVIGGRVWRGAQGRANAMGHMVLWPDGAPCYCGGRVAFAASPRDAPRRSTVRRLALSMRSRRQSASRSPSSSRRSSF